MIPFDRIGRVDQFVYLRCVLKIAAQILPVIPPGTDDDWIFLAPFGVEIGQLRFSLFQCCSLVDRLQVCKELLLVLAGDVLERVAYLVDYAELRISLREHCVYGVKKALEPIDTGDEYVL